MTDIIFALLLGLAAGVGAVVGLFVAGVALVAGLAAFGAFAASVRRARRGS